MEPTTKEASISEFWDIKGGPPTKEAALAPISVYWDIKSCPVPDGYVARRVSLCIERFLRKSGYNGPITITAVGVLSEFPLDILEGFSFTGVSLHNIAFDPSDMVSLFLDFCCFPTPTPHNMMIISCPSDHIPSNLYDFLSNQRKSGKNTIFPFPLDSSQDAECLWRDYFLLPFPPREPWRYDKDKCTESWVCAVCEYMAGQGLGQLLEHLSSLEHEWVLKGWLMPYGDEEDLEAGSSLDYATTMESEEAIKGLF